MSGTKKTDEVSGSVLLEVGDLSMIRETKDLIGQRDDFARDQPQERFAVHVQFVKAGEAPTRKTRSTAKTLLRDRSRF